MLFLAESRTRNLYEIKSIRAIDLRSAAGSVQTRTILTKMPHKLTALPAHTACPTEWTVRKILSPSRATSLSASTKEMFSTE